MQEAIERGERQKEVKNMSKRIDEVKTWLTAKSRREEIEPTKAIGLDVYDEDIRLGIPVPKNEQEVFHLYTILSARFRVPLRVISYDASHGIDAIAQVVSKELFSGKPKPIVAVEFKYKLNPSKAINHYFDAIDAFICWKVDGTGQLSETGDADSGTLRMRAKPMLPSKMDSHEVVYRKASGEGDERILPVLSLALLFEPDKK